LNELGQALIGAALRLNACGWGCLIKDYNKSQQMLAFILLQ